MANPSGGDVVEADLDDELGAQLDPLEVAPVRPAARLAGSALSRLVPREGLDQLALLLRLQPGGMPDHPQLPVGVVEAEDERADGALLLARTPAADDGVDRAHALDLHHARPLARPVGRVELLGDHALGAAQPRLGVLARVRAWSEVDRRVDDLLEHAAALGVGALEQRLVIACEHVERYEARGRLARQALDPRPRRVDALPEGVEVLDPALAEDDDLAVEPVPAGHEVELGEVALAVGPVARVQAAQAAVEEGERAEAGPLGLVGPVLAVGQGGRRPGELG